jgi:hypothetical protein
MVNKNIFLMQGKKEVGIARFRSSVKTEAPHGIKLPMPKKPHKTYVYGEEEKCWGVVSDLPASSGSCMLNPAWWTKLCAPWLNDLLILNFMVC